MRNLPWEFTIHGLWPVDSNGNGLTNPISPPMKRNDISQVIQHHPQSAFSVDMNTYWPSLTMSNVDLWLNEWNNHGIYQNSLGPTAYFNNTIQVVKHMNLKQILAEEGIVPSNSRPYWRRRYITAITKRTQARHPLILCNPTPYGRFPVLREVVICVDTIANSFVPCPVPPHYRSLCPGGQIWFLQFLP